MTYAQQTGTRVQPNQYRLWRWWIGLCFVIFGALFDFVALKFAPQSVIMPAGAISLGINPLFASLWLGEKFTVADIKGTALIIAGAAGVACSYAILGTVSDHEYTLAQLLELYSRPVMFAYALIIVGAIRYLSTLMRRYERLRSIAIKRNNDEDDLDSRTGDGCASSLELGLARAESSSGGSISTGDKAGEFESTLYAEVAQWHPLTYGALSGIFGAQSVLFAKSTVELVATSLREANQFGNPCAFGVVACMLLSIAGQTHYLAEGLKHFDALIIVPVFQCFLITFSILGGATYFGELGGFSAQQWALFLASVATALHGVGVLARSRQQQAGQPRRGRGALVGGAKAREVVCAEEYGDHMGLGGLEMASMASPSPSTTMALGRGCGRGACASADVVCLSTLEEAGAEAGAVPAAAAPQQQQLQHPLQQRPLQQQDEERQMNEDIVTVEESVENFLFAAADPVIVGEHMHGMWGGGVVQRQTSNSSAAAVSSPNDHGGIMHL